jgi:hypothetical protein
VRRKILQRKTSRFNLLTGWLAYSGLLPTSENVGFGIQAKLVRSEERATSPGGGSPAGKNFSIGYMLRVSAAILTPITNQNEGFFSRILTQPDPTPAIPPIAI